jgi:hypothetical protein
MWQAMTLQNRLFKEQGWIRRIKKSNFDLALTIVHFSHRTDCVLLIRNAKSAVATASAVVPGISSALSY